MEEHKGLHRFLPSWNKRQRMAKQVKANAIEPMAYKARHDILTAEICSRGHRHQSPMKQPDVSGMLKHHRTAQVFRRGAWRDLFDHCPDCQQRLKRISEERFIQYRPLAQRVAREYCKKYNRPLYETQDHADFALALLLIEPNGHNPQIRPLKQWLTIKIRYHLKEIYLRGRHPNVEGVKETIACYLENSASDQLKDHYEKTPPNWIQNLLTEVTEETAAVVRIIMEAPEDLLNEICPEKGRTMQKKRRNLKAYLIDVLDWEPHDVNVAFEEMITCLQ